MSKLYIRLLYENELGYRAGIPGSAGRFIFISKETGDFFPYLSPLELNDTVLIPIVPYPNQQKVYCKLVYHNDKFSRPFDPGTRNETRLYLNSIIDPNHNYFKPDEIVVIQKIDNATPEGVVPIYYLYKFTREDPYYVDLRKILSEGGKGGHALVDIDLPFLINVLPPVDEMKVSIPPELPGELKKMNASLPPEGKVSERFENLFNSDSFRDFVLEAYGHQCAITRKSISWNQLYNLEAAHIMPRAHKGNFLPSNGIALCRDMHWAFDKGFITISEDYRVIVHSEIHSTFLDEFNEVRITLPTEDFFKPDKTSLLHHKEKIFGLFQYSGSIRALKI